MHVEKNDEAMERKHFLMRKLDHHYITEEVYNTEVSKLDVEIAENLKEALIKVKDELKTEIQQIKETVYGDGDFKRAVASTIIKLFEEDLTGAELKGMFRQGYKIMRTKC